MAEFIDTITVFGLVAFPVLVVVSLSIQHLGFPNYTSFAATRKTTIILTAVAYVIAAVLSGDLLLRGGFGFPLLYFIVGAIALNLLSVCVFFIHAHLHLSRKKVIWIFSLLGILLLAGVMHAWYEQYLFEKELCENPVYAQKDFCIK